MISDLVNTTGQESTISRDTWPTNILKNYETVILREGKDAIDAEVNELQDLMLYERLALTSDLVSPGYLFGNVFGDNVSRNSFNVTCDGTNVYVAAGRGRWMNRRIDLLSQLSSGVSGNALSGLTLPSPGHQLYIYLDLFVREMDGNPGGSSYAATRTVPGNDPYLADPVLDVETSRRVQFFNPAVDIQATVIDSPVPAPATGHTIAVLALLQNNGGVYTVTDLRQKAQVNNVFLPGGSAYVTVLVANNGFVANNTDLSVDTLTGGPGTLTFVTPGASFQSGNRITLALNNVNDPIILTHASGHTGGQLFLAYGVNVTLDNTFKRITFEYNGTDWYEVDRNFGDTTQPGFTYDSTANAISSATGILYPTTGNHTVVSSAVNQQVTNINQSVLADGKFLTLSISAGSSIVLIHGGSGSGQLLLAYGQNEVINNTSQVITFKRSGSTWVESSRSFGDPRDVGYAADTTILLGFPTTGWIVPTAGNHEVDTSGGAGNLSYISTSYLNDGHLLVLEGANPSSDLVTVVSSAGGANQIHLIGGTACQLIAGQVLVLKRSGTDWYEVSRSISPAPSSSVPTGVLLPFGGTVAPSGFLLCDGSLVSRTTYASLFSVINTAFGAGNGSTTFAVPDTRGRFLRGTANMPAISGSGSASANAATFTAHPFTQSGKVVQMTSGALTGLTTGVTYYVIVVDANTLAFATSLANALANTRISISGSNSAVIQQWEDPDALTRVSPDTGANSGDAVGSLEYGQIQSHVHTYTEPNNLHAGTGAGNDTPQTPYPTANTGATGGNETRSINLGVNHIIKT